MLARAARRRQAIRHIEHVARQIQLPWLCPALARPNTVTTQRRTTTSRPSPLQSHQTTVRPPQTRKLASAASISDDFDNGDEYLPFTYERSAPSLLTQPDSIPRLEISDLLLIDSTTVPTPGKLGSHSSGELRGNSFEIEATLEACLQVQRWDRAFTLLSQLRKIHVSNPLQLQRAYNRVLEAMVFDLIWNRNTQNEEKINVWIEVYLKEAGVDPDAYTFALKIKSALGTLEGSQRDRTVRRYWNMAREYQFENQVASLRNILSDSDLGKLTEICPLEIEFDLPSEPGLEKDADTTVSERATPRTSTGLVREVDQKGMGLISLRRALSLFSDPAETSETPRFENKMQQEEYLRLRQLKLEQDSIDAAVERWEVEHDKRTQMGVDGGFTQGKLGALLWQWHELMTQRLEEELKLIAASEDATKKTPEDRLRCEYGPFLRLLQPQRIAALTTISVMQIMSRLGINQPVKIVRLVTEIGRALEGEIEAQRAKHKKLAKKAKPRRKESSDTQQDMNTMNSEPTQSSGQILHESRVDDRRLHWTVAIHAKVGAILCEILFDVAKVTTTKDDPNLNKKVSLAEPAFPRRTLLRNGRNIGVATTHHTLQELLAKQPATDLIAKLLPMIVKPEAWTGFNTGGYLETPQSVIRVKFDDVAQRDYAKAAARRGDLDSIYAGLDVLGATGWVINRNVFDVMLEAWNSGEAIANLPPLEKTFPDLPKPAESAPSHEKWHYYKKVRAVDNEKSGLHSNRCFQNFQMEIARAYLDKTFYLPHSIDFRGRAYPIPPYLNQMGADNARGLLLFAKGRELGPDGLRWIQVHVANVFGYDKASLTDRAQFAMDHLEDIEDSVNNPLNGRRWWLKAEDPWQCLAACNELVSALKCEDPSKFVSHLPVHQDGTCNGLQHYAALGGDMAGARQVNLEPGDKPADVYTGVAELVKAEIRQDAANGVELAKLLDGRITRKIVKQTVMTNVYGVTFTGAIRQVKKQVDDILPDFVENGNAGPAAIYIAKKIFKGLGTLFEGAHEIQYWLGDCASRITHSISPAQLKRMADGESGRVHTSSVVTAPSLSNARKEQDSIHSAATDFRSTIVWTTPLRLPVVQPYRVSRAQTVSTQLQHFTLVEPNVADTVDHRKQLQGFPPNFVHSLDATHMMLSAIKAKEIGMSFSAVHDSFWTHAADVDNLNTLLRDAFIRMHSEDIIGRLAAEFRARYQGHIYLARVSRHCKIGRAISEHRRALNALRLQRDKENRVPKGNRGVNVLQRQRYEELLLEYKRARLLVSKDPLEREEGQKMVTAASLFEKYHGEKHLFNKASLGQTAVGEMSEANPSAVEEALHADDVKDNVDLENTLDPIMNPKELKPMFSVSDQEAKNGEKAKPDQTEKKDEKEKKPKRIQTALWLWLPLTFKNVPKKGEFDVRRLKDSTYFFS